MVDERVLKDFAQRLNSDVRSRFEELDEETPLRWDVALTQAAMDYIGDTGDVTSDDLCPHEDVDGHKRCKVVAYGFDDDATRLDVYTSLWVDYGPMDQIPVLSKEEVGRWPGWAYRFVTHALKKDLQRFASNPVALAVAKEIRSKVSTLRDVRVHFITNALVKDRSVEPVTDGPREVMFDVWDIGRLQRAGDDVKTRDLIDIDFTKVMGEPLKVLEANRAKGDYQTFLAVLPGKVLAELYNIYAARLFEFNVRSFLQAKGKVNKGIRRTLVDEPERFLAYNNGLTATADEIDVGSVDGVTVLRRVRGLQIVNGAQTTASIHRAAREDKVDLEQVAVAMKLTCVAPAKLAAFVPKISEYANTQNPVQAADLSANGEFHIELERLSESLWCPGEESRWFYERARGAYAVARSRAGSKKKDFDRETPKAQCFGKTELAKFWMSWWALPHVVSKGGQKNYAAFMAELTDRFDKDWKPDEVFLRQTAGIALLFKAAQSVTRKARLGSYVANVVAYMISRLAAEHGDVLDLESIWDRQEVSDEMKSVFEAWAPLIHAELVRSAGRENVTEWAKKEGCWKAVRELLLPWPELAPSEFGIDEEEPVEAVRSEASAVQDDDLVDEEEAVIEECRALDGRAWGSVVMWASDSPFVARYDRRVAHTVSGYALNDWERLPTLKQARIASRVLAAARKYGPLA